MSLDYDCLIYVAEHISDPRDWQSFGAASTLTHAVANYLGQKKQKEFNKKWIKILCGRRIIFIKEPAVYLNLSNCMATGLDTKNYT